MNIYAMINNNYFLDRAYRDEYVNNENFSTEEYLLCDPELEDRCSDIAKKLEGCLENSLEKLLKNSVVSSWLGNEIEVYVGLWASDSYEIDGGLTIDKAESSIDWEGIHFDVFDMKINGNEEEISNCLYILLVKLLEERVKEENQLDVYETIAQSYETSSFQQAFLAKYDA